MTIGAGNVGCYQSDEQACFSGNSCSQFPSSLGNLPVRYMGRDVTSSRVGGFLTSERGKEYTSQEGAKNKSWTEKVVHSLYDPREDYKKMAGTSQKDLLGRITWDSSGMKCLKKYVNDLDKLDDRGRLGLDYKMDENLCRFCKEVRESALTIFRQFMSEVKCECASENGVLYLLKRLQRFEDLETHCRELLNPGGKKLIRVENIEVALIEALINLGRVEAACQQLEATKKEWGETCNVIDVEIKVSVAKKDFAGAYELLDKLQSIKTIREDIYQKRREWITRCSHQSESETLIETVSFSEQYPLGNPLRDFNRGLSTDEQFLRARMSHGEEGIRELKKHVNVLDKLDENGRGFYRSRERVYPRIVLFCLVLRERSLLIFEDFLKQHPGSKLAENGKLFLLKRLGRNSELLSYCDRLRSSGGSAQHINFKKIEALTALGRYPEALELAGELKYSRRDKVQLELAEIQIHMARCEWEESKKRLDSIRGVLHPADRPRYSKIIEWLMHCCDHPDEYITDIQYLRNFSLSSSINPELGFRQWVFDKASSEILVYGSDPVRDFNSGVRPDKDYLRILMLSWDERGLETIKRYFLRLDQYVSEKYGGMNSDVDSEEFGRVKDFCREARESGLSLVEDILHKKPHLNSAVLGKLFFLMHLERYQDALNHTENFLGSGSRLLPLELRRVEAFAEAGLFAEAWEQLEKTRRFFDKDRNRTELAAINLYIKGGDFSRAMNHLNGIKINNYIDEETYRRNVALIDRKRSDKMGSVSLIDMKSEAVEDFDDVGDVEPVGSAGRVLEDGAFKVDQHAQMPVDSVERVHGDGSYAARNISDPVRDFREKRVITNAYLRSVMGSWNEQGIDKLKRYFTYLDKKIDESGGIMKSKCDSDELRQVRSFCQNARECGLSIFQDFLRQNPGSKAALFSKVFLLERLGRYPEILQCTGYSQQVVNPRVLTLELKVIDALAELGRYKDAWFQIEATGSLFGKDKTNLSTVRLHVISGAFDDAVNKLNELKLNKKINHFKYDNLMKWIEHCKSEHNEEVDGSDTPLYGAVQGEGSSVKTAEAENSGALTPVSTAMVDNSWEFGGSAGLPGKRAEHGDESMVENADSFTNNQVYSLSESDQILLDSARRHHNDGFFSTAFTLLSVIRGRNIGENQTVDQLYLECEQKKGSCRVINFPKP